MKIPDVPKELIDQINDSKDILLLAHNKPDGDALGSVVAFGKGLKSLGKNVDYYIDPEHEPKLDFLPEMENFNQNLKDHYDSIMILDCSTWDYSFHPDKDITSSKLVSIDHHMSNKEFADINYVYETAACGELVYLILEKLGVELDNEIREAIFTAISSDTGSFQFSNTNADTHEITSKIYSEDINFAPISKRLHTTKSLEQMKLYGEAINSIELYDNGQIALLFLPYEIVKKYGGKANVTDDLANIGMNLDSTKVSVLVKEMGPEDLKMSIRSKAPYEIDVSKLATEYDGGGHYRASGFSYSGKFEDFKKELIKKLENLINE